MFRLNARSSIKKAHRLLGVQTVKGSTGMACRANGANRLLGLSVRELSSSTSSIERSGFSLPTMSQLVVHNGIVYISGQVDATAGDVTGQTKNILGQIDALLEEAGTDKTRLLTSNIWLKDIGKDFQAMNEVWIEWMDPDNKPVRATVEANMARPNLLVEIQVTAAKK
jgi:enamine deaminase RidA (YjgF/YER057c/UK114 family)